MVIAIVVLHVCASLFLIAVILLQAGRGQGLSWGMMGGSPQSILGTKTASFLTRLTTICAFLFLFTCIGLNLIEIRRSKSLMNLSRGASQVDLTKIKEALDKIKKEPATVAATQATDKTAPAAETTKADTAETAKAAQTTAAEATKTAEASAIPADATEKPKTAETKVANQTKPQT